MIRLLCTTIIIISVFSIFSSCKKDILIEVPISYLYYEVDGIPTEISSKTDLTFYFGGTIQTISEEKPTSNLY